LHAELEYGFAMTRLHTWVKIKKLYVYVLPVTQFKWNVSGAITGVVVDVGLCRLSDAPPSPISERADGLWDDPMI
jgi:hypothetical protein